MMDNNNTGCSIFGDGIRVIAEHAEKPFMTQGSALQNPELSRARLLGMLRRATRSASGRPRQQWAAFMASYKAQEPANTNR